MKEYIVVGMLALALTLGFIFSIEVLAQGHRSFLNLCTINKSELCKNMSFYSNVAINQTNVSVAELNLRNVLRF